MTIHPAGVQGKQERRLELKKTAAILTGNFPETMATNAFPLAQPLRFAGSHSCSRALPEPGRVRVMPACGVFARHVRDLELANIHTSCEKEDLRPAIGCVDVDGQEIDNFKAQLAPGVPAARFDSVTNVIIRNSPVLEGVTAK